MNKTYTPDLDAGVLQRLAEYAASFTTDFSRSEQARWTEVYLRGLLQDGDRKSVEPLVGRVRLPEACQVSDPVQAVRHFVGHGHWDHERVLKRYRARMAAVCASPDGIFVVDDTDWRKQGSHSVGVQRQYSGSAGKTANCQVAVSWHYVSSVGHYPLAVRLYLPESWTENEKRLDEGKVPADQREFKTKPLIAIQLLDQVRAEGLAGRFVVADAGYGRSSDFREALQARELLYAVGVQGDEGVFPEEPRWVPIKKSGNRKTPKGRRLDPSCNPPLSVKELAKRVPLRRCTWREGTKGKLFGRFGRVRVWAAHDWDRGGTVGQEPLWLIVEQRSNETKYYLSNLPEETSLLKLVRLVKSRWPVEQGYQQMKEELGLDHFEGRRWSGFHHHACLVFLAYGFLLLERLRLTAARNRRREKNARPMPDTARRAAGAPSDVRDPVPEEVSEMQVGDPAPAAADLTE